MPGNVAGKVGQASWMSRRAVRYERHEARRFWSENRQYKKPVKLGGGTSGWKITGGGYSHIYTDSGLIVTFGRC
jgi:hypothetical protein